MPTWAGKALSKKTFSIVATCICWAIALTYFLGPRYSMVELLPMAIVFFLAYSIFKYEKPSDEIGVPLSVILAVFFGMAIYYFYDEIADRRALRELYRECQKHVPTDSETVPFAGPCSDARDWYFGRYR